MKISWFCCVALLATHGMAQAEGNCGDSSDPTLAGATRHVTAKTGTFVQGADSDLLLKGQAFGGYITTKSGKQLVYELVVNNVAIDNLNDLLQIFQDEGRISAMLWRDN